MTLGLSACVVPPVGPPRGPGIAQVDHHDLRVTVGDVLTVEDRMTLTPDGRTLAFRIRAGLWIDSVRVGGRELDFEEAPGPLGRIVRVDVPARATAVTVELSGDPGHGVSDEFVYLPAHSGWYPAPLGGRAARFDVSVEVPGHLQVMGSGLRSVDRVEGDRREVRFESVLPVPGWTLTAGPYDVRRQVVGGTPVEVWLLQGGEDHDTLSATYLSASARHLTEGVRRFGPFPHPSFAIVEVPFPAGQGHAGYTLLGSAILRLPFIPDTSARHELFHCWWGNGVLGAPATGNWSEGLTSYLADHEAAALKDGDGGARYRWQVLYDTYNFGVSDPPPLIQQVSAQEDRTLGYGKASMVFHMLRRRVGDDAFDRGLRRATAEAMGRQIDWFDLLDFIAIEAGQSLQDFVDRWLLGTTVAPAPGPEADFYAHLNHAQVAPSFDLVAHDKRRQITALIPEFQEVAEALGDPKDWPALPADQVDPTVASLMILAAAAPARRTGEVRIAGHVIKVPTDREWPAGTTLMFAASPAWAPGHSVGVMLAEDLEALKKAADRLKWYSRYGWLVFEGKANLDKGYRRPPSSIVGGK